MCAVEYASWARGATFGDQPSEGSAVAAAYLRAWNDGLDDARRQHLKPAALRLYRTSAAPADEARRAERLAAWLRGRCSPAWLVCAGMDEPARQVQEVRRAAPAVARATMIAVLREIVPPEPLTWHARVELERVVRGHLSACGAAAAWVAYRDWVWADADTFALPGPAVEAAWYGWLLSWRALHRALVIDPDRVARTAAALRRSAFTLLDRITATAA